MDARPTSGFDAWRAALRDEGFAFAPAAEVRPALARAGALDDWPAFVASWDDLHVDPYMADAGRYRRRRHAVLHMAADGAWSALPRQPHYQTLDYNPLHGGIERWFEPIAPAVRDGATLRTVLAAAHRLFAALSAPSTTWRVELHQFRIEAGAGTAGKPTPEGVHRDGVDWVLVLMVRRTNIAAGTTTIHDLARREIGAFTLVDPFDAALVDDRRCFHGVTPVVPLDAARPAHRDVLVATFRALPV
ncbi:MAG: 2OG-Fe dioxygenase family protein [Xanthomonadaceae bacterium]|jgi:hypothetical protein|nr:2OG-Fe dioxygenase family protein [Xanthomonadaceae bacterium]